MKGRFGKRAQGPSGGNAAILVAVIGMFIVLYILFLPKGERDKVLDRDTEKSGAVSARLPGSVLLIENPGTLTKLMEREFEHRLASFNLFTKKEDTVLKSFDSIYVETSRGSDRRRAVALTVKDRVENARLSFTVNSHSGNLVIRHNDEDLFTGEVETFTEPISLELAEENVFEFYTDPVPWYKPFSKNFYDLRDVSISGSVERLDNKEAVQTIILGEEEANLLSEASLSFFVDCNVREVGRLAVNANGKLISSRVPDCGSPERLQLDPEDLSQGKNDFRFVAEKGSYLVDQVILRTKLKEPIFPVYFFSINNSLFRKIDNNTINSTLSLTFVDDRERKTATVEINGQKTRIDTRAANFSKSIDMFLTAGTNFIRLVPETTLHVLEMRVLLDCKRAEECG
ncbi:TPA: hypothetical protein HA231_03600 [Candidatus Woesearchaeota archaeon]|nr:hypothetical protein [Candidatus Woesearchaeota archaeon]